MYIELKNQKEVINQAIKKAKGYRKLSKQLGIPKSSLVRYYQESKIPKERLDKIINFLNINPRELEIKELENNWKQKIGGKNCVEARKKKGIFEEQLKTAQKKGALKLKEWHKNMKKNKPREYYLIQYSRFKKIGGYKYKTEKGEKVRNILEKQVADILNKLNVQYEYEPLIKSDNCYFFPDFLVNGHIILECTMWRGEMKAYKLKEKIKHLKKNYKVFVIIPKNLYTYYKILNHHLIKGLDEFVPVAQTFLSCKK